MADKGVIVEYDFTALNGAGILFETTKRFLDGLDGIAFDARLEARYLTGNDYLQGLQGLFSAVKTKKTAAKASRDLPEAFAAEVTSRVKEGLTQGFRNFVKTLGGRDVKVVLATRADICADAVRAAFGDLLSDNVTLYQEPSDGYGSVKWTDWRQACVRNSLRHVASVAVTGSGFGVKTALLAGLGVLGVVNDRVAYQDFGGAAEVVSGLDTAAAKKVLSILRIS